MLKNDKLSLLNVSKNNLGAKQWTVPLNRPFPCHASLSTSPSDFSQSARHPVQFGQTYSGHPESSLSAQKPADGLIGSRNQFQSPQLQAQDYQAIPNPNELHKTFQITEPAQTVYKNKSEKSNYPNQTIDNSEKYIIDNQKFNQTEGISNFQNLPQVKPFSPVISSLNQKRNDILSAIDANYD